MFSARTTKSITYTTTLRPAAVAYSYLFRRLERKAVIALLLGLNGLEMRDGG